MESTDVEGAPGTAATLEREVDATLAVKVALNIRPIIALERLQGCKDCINLVAGEPQVQIGSHSFTFDHVFGSTATPLSAIFDECVSPLVDGLFHGYNATVLAYGQTGSGKTYTMGTGYTVGGSTEGVIPQVMETIFKKIDGLKDKAEFQIRVSFIEILKEEIHDLLDPSPPTAIRTELTNGGAFGGGVKSMTNGKPPIQIRETTNGGITLAGVTETDVNSLSEMALCLEQGSLCRATGSTNMNSRSSRSHAIFTITVEQRRKWEFLPDGGNPLLEDASEDYLCAKLHLVDLAGSERAKRTGADGLRFKEGVHINKGLLALGNVISALGDDKKRKEGGHVPYRDSKLTRLLQDSLGGNSRTVMIACVSPADSNAEETLNTLKYANRARNIQNKPTVNRDPMAAEMQRMRQQLELMQAELLCARAGCAPEEIQVLKQKIAWLETANIELRQELLDAREQFQILSQEAIETQVQRDKLQLKLEKLRAGKTFAEIDDDDDSQVEDLLRDHLLRIKELEEEMLKLQASGVASRPRSALPIICSGEMESMESIASFTDPLASTNPMSICDVQANGEVSGEAEAEAVAKEWEHNMAQETLDKELQELNKRLEQKEAEMKTFVRSDALVLKQHFEKKLLELEEEKKVLQRERDMLVTELETLTATSDEHTQKLQETHVQKLKHLETQIAELKKKQDNQSQLLRQKQRGDEAAKRLQDEIHRIKTQKVQLQQKIKQESEQFRSWKASRERELLQLRKEGRRTEYEMHKLQALNQRQKLVVQRKTEEAAAATRRLKELLERKSVRDNVPQSVPGTHSSSGQSNEKALQHWLDQELEMAVRVHEVRSAYEKHTEERVNLARELAALKEEEEVLLSSGNQAPSMSPGARSARIRLLESMLNSSSSTLVAMASQLSEAEERERISGGRARWQQVRSMGDAKTFLQLAFDAAAFSKCQLQDAEEEHKEVKEKVAVLEDLLRSNECHRKELERQQRLREQPSLTTVTKAGFEAGMKSDSGRISQCMLDRGLANKIGRVSEQDSKETTFGGASFPYTLRKAARGLASSKNARCDESDFSEGELDMDTDQSDEDWDEYLERQAPKRNRGVGDRCRLSRAGSRSLSLDQKQSSDSVRGLHGHEEESLKVRTLRPSPGESIFQDNEHKGKQRCWCSCSHSSGCKTKKCECKAAGGVCGLECSCKAARCANRETLAVEAEPSSMVSSIQVEMAETLENQAVDKTRRRFHDPSETIAGKGEFLLGFMNGEKDRSMVGYLASKADRVLAVHGATLLEKAWNEERECDVVSEATDGSVISNQRRPLKDIGNSKISLKNKPIAKQKRKTQNALIQLVPVEPLSNVLPANAASGIAATAAAAASNLSAPNNPVLPLELVSPIWRQHSFQRRTNSVSPQLSPLRLRENKVGDSKGGIGASTEDSKKSGNGPGSPAGPGRGGADEKENIQRNSFV